MHVNPLIDVCVKSHIYFSMVYHGHVHSFSLMEFLITIPQGMCDHVIITVMMIFLHQQSHGYGSADILPQVPIR